MTAREAIESFLDEHGYFTAAEVSTASGLGLQKITAASFKMRKSGEIILQERQWRVGVYVLADDDRERPVSRDGINTIFSECLASDAMKRVLSIYGRQSP